MAVTGTSIKAASWPTQIVVTQKNRQKKFSDNRARDQRVTEQLLDQGWRVVVIWECVTRDMIEFEKEILKLNSWIKAGKSQYFESDYKKT